MAIKKSELYSSLWKSCDELRGGMDASQYKDFRTAPLLDAYDVYQHLMDYWDEAMQDDVYQLAAEGWVARIRELSERYAITLPQIEEELAAISGRVARHLKMIGGVTAAQLLTGQTRLPGFSGT